MIVSQRTCAVRRSWLQAASLHEALLSCGAFPPLWSSRIDIKAGEKRRSPNLHLQLAAAPRARTFGLPAKNAFLFAVLFFSHSRCAQLSYFSSFLI
jgi:hypothetical protein